MFHNFDLGSFLLAIPPILLAITLYEVAGGYMARRHGDRTAEQAGRLTLNPLAHIDPIGTVILPGVLFFTTGFIFGWARPIPINRRNFRNLRIGIRMVALAGPLSNLIMMFIWAAAAGLAPLVPAYFELALSQMAQYGIFINAIFFVINMLPIPPLAGGSIIDTFLSPKASANFRKIQPYGTWIILILLVSGLLEKIMQPFLMLLFQLANAFIQLLSV